MTIALSQVIIPVAAVGTLDDSAFTIGQAELWAAIFAAQVVATRANGVLCRGRAYVSLDVAQRMFGGSLPEVGDWNSPLSIQTFSSEYERVNVFCDLDLAENTVRIE